MLIVNKSDIRKGLLADCYTKKDIINLYPSHFLRPSSGGKRYKNKQLDPLYQLDVLPLGSIWILELTKELYKVHLITEEPYDLYKQFTVDWALRNTLIKLHDLGIFMNLPTYLSVGILNKSMQFANQPGYIDSTEKDIEWIQKVIQEKCPNVVFME